MDASQQYNDTAITTQDRGKLIVMLYDGAIKFLKTARGKLEEGDFASKGVYIGKAQDIISELNCSLEPEADPELADNLRGLYNFLYHHLTVANIERDTEKIEECVEILDQLRDAWDNVADKVGAGDALGGPDVSAGGFQA